MNKKIFAFIIIVVLIVIALFAVNSALKQDAKEPKTAPEEVLTPSVSAPDQAGGMEVFITEAVLPDGGFVVIHNIDKDVPGDVVDISGSITGGVIGEVTGVSEFIPAGSAVNFLVALDEEAVEGDTLFAMLYTDNGDGVWDAQLDIPLTVDGDVVVLAFRIVGEGALENEEKL